MFIRPHSWLNKDMPDNKEKFFFDIHKFDEDEDALTEEQIEFLEKEAEMTRSHQEQLEIVRKEAYESGKKDGIAETLLGLEQKIVVLLEEARGEFLKLQSQEHIRETRYEREAVALAVQVIEQLFPVWTKHHGQEELFAALQDILSRVRNQKEIIIQVAPSLRDEAARRLEDIKADLNGISFKVEESETLNETAFKLKWADGGAVRDGNALAAQIVQRLSSELNSIRESVDETPPPLEDNATNPQNKTNPVGEDLLTDDTESTSHE